MTMRNRDVVLDPDFVEVVVSCSVGDGYGEIWLGARRSWL
jgi:hypothetical protein